MNKYLPNGAGVYVRGIRGGKKKKDTHTDTYTREITKKNIFRSLNVGRKSQPMEGKTIPADV